MENEELDKTKPIKSLNDINDVPKSRLSEEEKPLSREEKYKEAIELEDKKEMEEAAEEALAEKNINEAESLLEQEAEALEDVDPDELVEEEKYVSDKKGFAKLVDIWKHLDKTKKIIYCVIAGLVLILIILMVLAVILLADGNEKSDPKPENNVTENVEEAAPEIISNYYYKDGTLHFVDANESELGTYTCTNKDEKLCFVAVNNYRDTFDVPKLVNEDGEEIKQVLPIYNDNYAFVFDNKSTSDKNIILYDIDKQSNLETYTSVKGYDDNYVIVATTAGKYGLLQFKDGLKELIKPQYTYLGMIDGSDNLIAKSAKGYLVINKSNKIQSKAIPAQDQIKYYNNKMVVTISSNSYTLYNYDAKVLANRVDFISINDKYAALVENGTVKVIDSDGNLYNEEGFVLKNDYLVKNFVYDENGALKEAKKSFTIDIKGKDVAIVVYDGDEDKFNYIDLNVPKINAKYQYVNYFDGKLYFYKDATKKELLGSYSCGLKNEVNADSTSYNECFVALDTIFEDNDMMSGSEVSRVAYSAIINGKYVFIKDSDSVYLYDIESRKSIAPYSKVNTYSNANSNVIAYNGEVNVVALNKKGLYGMIRITGSAVTPIYPFNYKRIEKLGEYYIGLTTADKWVILSLDSSIEYSDKIMGYNKTKEYYKTKGSAYYVYDKNGNKVSEDGYDYVALYQDFYAGLNSEKMVYIYDYNGNKLTDKGVKVTGTNYSKTDNPAFFVTKKDGKYIVSVLEGNEYKEYSTVDEAPSEPEEPSENPGEQQS